MDLLKVVEVSSIQLLDLRLSEGELMVYESCIDYVLGHCGDEELVKVTGCADRDELTAFREDLRDLLRAHMLPQYLPDKYKR